MYWRQKSYWLIILLIGLTGVLVNLIRYSEVKPPQETDFSLIPLNKGEWLGEEYSFPDYAYEVLKPDDSTLRRYTDDNGNYLWLFIAYFKSQKYGAQIHSPKHCLPGGGWKILSQDEYVFHLSSSENLKTNKFLISDSKKYDLMFYWFITRGGTLIGEFRLKIDLVLNSLLRRPTDAAFVRITIPMTEDTDQTEVLKAMDDFMAEFGSAIEKSLPFD